jgi:hypothetical protein
MRFSKFYSLFCLVSTLATTTTGLDWKKCDSEDPSFEVSEVKILPDRPVRYDQKLPFSLSY